MTDWIAADWGTSRLRIWAIDGAGKITGSATSQDGMGSLTPDQFEPAFLRAAGHLLPEGRRTPVLICGMAGARTGWKEAGYVAVPAHPSGTPVPVPTAEPRLDVHILPGLSQAEPPDVMRGEETQIAGMLAATPDFDGLVCLPGTHTKWARVSEGRVTGFRTAMTGELFALVSGHSTLSAFTAEGWNEAAFDAALTITSDAPLTADLFSLRARGLLAGYAEGEGRARLSALLIGSEVAGMIGTLSGHRVALLGDPALCRLYETALARHGLTTETLDAEAVTLGGLIAARDRMLQTSTT